MNTYEFCVKHPHKAAKKLSRLEQKLVETRVDKLLTQKTLEAENAKLNAVVDAAKKAASQHGIVYPIPSSGEWAMTELKQALAALVKGDKT